MLRRVFDMRMADGSRHFGDLPESYDADSPEWYRVRDAVAALAGATLTGFTTDDVTEAWIDFRLCGHAFSVNNQNGSWWFFVDDPLCPEQLLELVLDHFETRLNPKGALARSHGPLERGYRVLVYEADSRISFRDEAELDAAKRYADDAASESESGVVVAYVFNSEFRLLHVGRHY